MKKEAFPNYTQLPSRLPSSIWWFLRAITLVITLVQIFLLFFKPEVGLVLFWQLLIPILPLSFAIAPGIWRNICPMAFLNQLPRTFGFSKEKTLSNRLRNVALYISITAFIIFVLLRQPLLNSNGTYLGLILAAALVISFLGGIVYKGKSGWCGTFCPLAPIQKAYGHAPLMLVKNGYCESCLGCQKNCYDFNPRATVLSDLNDSNTWWSEKRKFFIALLPGLIIAFFNSQYQESQSLISYLSYMFLVMGVSIGIFYILHNIFNINFYKLSSFFSMVALSIFYWYGTPILAKGIHNLLGIQVPDIFISTVQYAVILISIFVLMRGFLSELQHKKAQQSNIQATLGEGINSLKAVIDNSNKLVQIKDEDSGSQITLQPGETVLDALEKVDLPIMSGCRMGMCGSDPVVITDGLDNLEPPDENELNTLKRLGLEGRARLACCCRPKADISINLAADLSERSFDEHEIINEDEEHQCIVIVGNGIAGISTAERIREKDGNCRIIIITKEPYHFYNRMGLEKVIYGKTALQELYLMKEDWYKHNNIECWLNTQVNSIRTEDKTLKLGTGEPVGYDKLVLATGAKAFTPSQPCYHLSGVFTLRSAEDALAMRAWIQEHNSKTAVVLGGGVLGVEAVEALLQLGLKVSLIQADNYLMNQQLDLTSATILSTFLENKGVSIYTKTVIDDIKNTDKTKQVLLSTGETIETDMVLLCIGIRSDCDLARTANLAINRGVIVDNSMNTSNPDIYCVGDAAELPNAIGGLWSVGSEQGKIAAESLLGSKGAGYSEQSLPPVQLKVSGIDLKSFGYLKEGDGIKTFSVGSVSSDEWCLVTIKAGKIIGGVFVNSPLIANTIISMSKKTDLALSDEEIEKILKA